MPNTPKGLPYPPATDPVAQGAAAIQALAEAVDPKLGTSLITEVTLAAPGNTLGVTVLPAAGVYKSLHVEAVIVPTGADFANCDIDFDFLPAVAGQWSYGYHGQDAVGATAGKGAFIVNRCPMGRVQYHSVNGVGAPLYWAMVDVMPGWDAAVRHGILFHWFGRMGNAGAVSEIGFASGGAMWRQSGAQVAITGLQFVGSANFGAGSRLAIWGKV